jgi:hypothetical protein
MVYVFILFPLKNMLNMAELKYRQTRHVFVTRVRVRVAVRVREGLG